MATRPFSRYFLELRSGEQSEHRALVRLFDDGAAVAVLHFMREDLAPPNGQLHPDGIFELFFPVGVLASVIDVLRNEQPLHVVLEPHGTGGITMLPGFGEPVGEGE